ncbi:hypothetical protein llap_9158 [Limosa lapponica baueri]|uniref:Uncharacterized protein n=1 Tax=Limosa lapponica baueri TaxID=1758121 RepID=A0A2I0U387_LIMLA|nr:hypothetical protein llap_9158 [Limosa lapponica baueri]
MCKTGVIPSMTIHTLVFNQCYTVQTRQMLLCGTVPAYTMGVFGDFLQPEGPKQKGILFRLTLNFLEYVLFEWSELFPKQQNPPEMFSAQKRLVNAGKLHKTFLHLNLFFGGDFLAWTPLTFLKTLYAFVSEEKVDVTWGELGG